MQINSRSSTSYRLSSYGRQTFSVAVRCHETHHRDILFDPVHTTSAFGRLLNTFFFFPESICTQLLLLLLENYYYYYYYSVLS